RGSPAKGVWGQKLHRGFESLSLRHLAVHANATIRLTMRRPDLHNSASAPVAQLDRAPGYELGGRRFESFRARQNERKADGKPSAFSFFPAGSLPAAFRPPH